ncbi:MAG: hypothetical protein AAF617_16405 [Bacteroidota bacterium]
MYILVAIIFVFSIFMGRIKRYYKYNAQGWKAEKISYKQINYSEKVDGQWKVIQIDANITIGTFEPFFKSKEEWKTYPDWAQDRKKIINRVVTVFPMKDEIRLIGEDED